MLSTNTPPKPKHIHESKTHIRSHKQKRIPRGYPDDKGTIRRACRAACHGFQQVSGFREKFAALLCRYSRSKSAIAMAGISMMEVSLPRVTLPFFTALLGFTHYSWYFSHYTIVPQTLFNVTGTNMWPFFFVSLSCLL